MFWEREEERHGDPCRLNYDVGLKSCSVLCLALPAKLNSLWQSFLTSTEEKNITRSIAIYQVLGNVSVCSSNENTSGKAVQLESPHNQIYKAPLSLSKIQLSSVHDKQVSWKGVWWYHSLQNFQVLDGGANLYNSSKNVVLFLAYFLF